MSRERISLRKPPEVADTMQEAEARPKSAVYGTVGGKDPFQATELFKKMVMDFQDGMSKKKNWRSLFSANSTNAGTGNASDATFSGRDAVEYLLVNLGRFTTADVQRKNCTLLMQRFITLKVVEPLNDKYRGNFAEDKMYRLHTGTPFGFNSPGSNRAGSNPNLSETRVSTTEHPLADSKRSLSASRRSRLSISHGNLSVLSLATTEQSEANPPAEENSSRRGMATRRQAAQLRTLAQGINQQTSTPLPAQTDRRRRASESDREVETPFTCAEGKSNNQTGSISRREQSSSTAAPILSSHNYENWSIDDRSVERNGNRDTEGGQMRDQKSEMPEDDEENKENFYAFLNPFSRNKSKERRPKTPDHSAKSTVKSESRIASLLFRRPSLKRSCTTEQDRPVDTPILNSSRPLSEHCQTSDLLPSTNPPPKPRLLFSNPANVDKTDAIKTNLRPTPCISLTDLDEMRMWKSAWIECLSRHLSDTEMRQIRNDAWQLNEKELKWNAEQFESSGITRAQWGEQGKETSLFPTSVMSALNFLTHFPRINTGKMLYYGENQTVDMFKTMCKQLELEETMLTAAEGRLLLSILSPMDSATSCVSSEGTEGERLTFSPPDFGNASESLDIVIPSEKKLADTTAASTYGFSRTPNQRESQQDSPLVRVNKLDGTTIAFRLDNDTIDEKRRRSESGSVRSSRSIHHNQSPSILQPGSNRINVSQRPTVKKFFSPPRYEDLMMQKKISAMNFSPEQRMEQSPSHSSYQTCSSATPQQASVNSNSTFTSPPTNFFSAQRPGSSNSYNLQTSTPNMSSKALNASNGNDLFAAELFSPAVLPVNSAGISAAALLCLSLDHTRRRRLQYGIKSLATISTNYCLKLDPHGKARKNGVAEENRFIVLSQLSHVIVPSVHSPASPSFAQEQAEDMMPLPLSDAIRLCALLIDNYKPLLLDKAVCITIQNAAKAKIDAFILKQTEAAREGIAQIATPYCATISPTTYEAQRSDEKPLFELLDGLVLQQNMKPAIKLEKLKEFKRMYPHIYSARYPRPSPRSSSLSSLGSDPVYSAVNTLTHSQDPIAKLERQMAQDAQQNSGIFKWFKR